MRVMVVAVLLACGAPTPPRPVVVGAAAAPPADAGPAAPDAPPAVVHTACFPPRFGGRLTWFSATDTTASVCLRHGSPGDPDEETRCVDIDLATGAHRPGVRRDVPQPPPSSVRVIDDPRGVRVCRGAACTRLALRPIPAWPDGPRMTYDVKVSADGARALAQWPGDAEVILLDARTGTRLRTLAVAPCTSAFDFLDDAIWIQGSQCNWIDEWSYLLDRDGRPRAVLDQIDSMAARPARLDGSVWAILGLAGDGYVVFDAATGELRGAQPHTPHFADVGCHDCTPASAKTPSEAAPFTRTPGGRTLVFTAGVGLLTPDLGALAGHLPLAVCPDAPAP